MGRFFRYLLAALALVVLGYFGRAFYYGARTLHDLLGENAKLKQAIGTLTHEDQIGYAKVVRQERRDDALYTVLRFVETARDDKLKTVLDKQYEIEGDIVHFDALIVSFSGQAVLDGKKRALYLWRRVYGDETSPADGYPIETPGENPERYADLLRELRLPERKMFWEAIWDLANDPAALQQYGIKAVYGNAVYTRLRPGLIYVFKIGADGQVYPETVPAM